MVKSVEGIYRNGKIEPSKRFTDHSVRESKGSTIPYINFPSVASCSPFHGLNPARLDKRGQVFMAVPDTTANVMVRGRLTV